MHRTSTLCDIGSVKGLGFFITGPDAACCKGSWDFGADCTYFELLLRSVWIPWVQSQKNHRSQKTPGSSLTCICWVCQVPGALRALQGALKTSGGQQQQGNPSLSSQRNKLCCWGRWHWVNLKSASGTQGRPGSMSACRVSSMAPSCARGWRFILLLGDPSSHVHKGDRKSVV